MKRLWRIIKGPSRRRRARCIRALRSLTNKQIVDIYQYGSAIDEFIDVDVIRELERRIRLKESGLERRIRFKESGGASV